MKICLEDGLTHSLSVSLDGFYILSLFLFLSKKDKEKYKKDVHVFKDCLITEYKVGRSFFFFFFIFNYDVCHMDKTNFTGRSVAW